MPPLTFDLNFRGTFEIKQAFELVLRQLFASTIVSEDFRYVDPPDPRQLRPYDDAASLPPDDNGGARETKIRIYRSFPKRIASYPAILIGSQSFDSSLTALGETKEERYAAPNDQGILLERTFGGHYIVPIELRIYSRESPDDRDRLTDTLLILLRILARNYFARFGISYTKIRVSGENQYEDGRDGIMIFTDSIVLQCQTDYELRMTQDQAEMFEKLLLRVGLQATPDSPVQYFDGS